jgi:PHD-finger
MYEVVTGGPIDNKKQHKERTSNGSSKVNKSAPKAGNPSKVPQAPPPRHKEEEDVEDMDTEEGAEEEVGEEEGQAGSTPCGACGESYGTDEFWICCDACERWFHGKCVRITPARAEHIKHYKCPGCSNKRARA